MEVVTFVWQAKYGHFLRAESNVNALTYPVPPRTAVLGLLGAILGLEKDALALSWHMLKSPFAEYLLRDSGIGSSFAKIRQHRSRGR